jgi:hypothetical protein
VIVADAVEQRLQVLGRTFGDRSGTRPA